jgi:hypothetical protein
MELAMKVGVTLLALAAIFVFTGITVDTAKGYGSNWAKVVWVGGALLAASTAIIFTCGMIQLWS